VEPKLRYSYTSNFLKGLSNKDEKLTFKTTHKLIYAIVLVGFAGVRFWPTFPAIILQVLHAGCASDGQHVFPWEGVLGKGEAVCEDNCSGFSFEII
jgi:hypothetical protein